MDAIIALRGLTKHRGARRALDGIDLDVQQGSVFGLLGPNGSGKSTTIRLMLGLQRPTTGEVRLFGERVRPGATTLERVGALVERPSFYPYLSAEQNLRLFAVARGRSTSDAQELALEAIQRAGLATVSRQAVGSYSTGMRQRLGIGLALLGDPELVILDEPTAGLDPEGIADVRSLMTTIASRGGTVFISTHQLDEAERVCSDVAILASGRVLTSGRTGEVTTIAGRSRSLEEIYLDHVHQVHAGER